METIGLDRDVIPQCLFCIGPVAGQDRLDDPVMFRKRLLDAVQRAQLDATIRLEASMQRTSLLFENARQVPPLWDTLFAMDANFHVEPQLVDTYSVGVDGTLYDFTLRSGLIFQDGAPVTSADVIASFSRWLGKGSLGQDLLIEPVGGRVFRVP